MDGDRELRLVAPSGTGAGIARTHPKPGETDVFCGPPRRRPDLLFETENFYVIPDLYPVSPGHALVIPKRHYPAYGAVPARFQREYAYAVERTRQFLSDAYNVDTMLWENGGVGQSVPHAHWQIIPFPRSAPAIPAAVQATPICGYSDVRRWWRHGQRYHYLEFRGEKRLLPHDSRDMWDITVYKTIQLHIPVSPDGRWVRNEDPASIADCVSRYRQWARTHPQREFLTRELGVA